MIGLDNVVLWMTLSIAPLGAYSTSAASHVGVAFRSEYACQKAKTQMLEAYAKQPRVTVLAAECLEVSRPGK